MWGTIFAGIKAVAFGGGSGKGATNIEKAASFIGRQYDTSKYTEQERAEANKGQIEGFQKWFGMTVNENTERSITRRSLALLVMRLAVILTVFSVVVWRFDKEWAKFTLEWFKVWWPLVAGVGLFFFGTHLARSWNEKKK